MSKKLVRKGHVIVGEDSVFLTCIQMKINSLKSILCTFYMLHG